MNVNAVNSSSVASAYARNSAASTAKATKVSNGGDAKTEKAFQDFVGQTFYGQMLKAMRKSTGKAAYFNGGHAEEVFRQQFDQVLAEKLSDSSAEQFSKPMYELFRLNRRA